MKNKEYKFDAIRIFPCRGVSVQRLRGRMQGRAGQQDNGRPFSKGLRTRS